MIIEVVQGDITKAETDAIVNAANSSLMGGGGVDGAIHRAGGQTILEECREIRKQQGECPTGEAVITTAGNLPSKFIIHTVGPVWRGGHFGEASLLEKCYQNSLKLAEKNGLVSISFPNISTGIYGYPKEEAARIAVSSVNAYVPHTKVIKKVVFICFDRENFEIYRNLI
jgi:O-acetyl-ADP-ribose deacetylase (regulator of RNase III)